MEWGAKIGRGSGGGAGGKPVDIRWCIALEHRATIAADAAPPTVPAALAIDCGKLPPSAEPQPRPKTLLKQAEAIWPNRLTRPEAIRWCRGELGLTERAALAEYWALPGKLRYKVGEHVK
jgi:hypothetical protein